MIQSFWFFVFIQMERLRGASMNQNIHGAMEVWLNAIKYVNECRKQEIANVAKRQKELPHCIPMHDDKGAQIPFKNFRNSNFNLSILFDHFHRLNIHVEFCLFQISRRWPIAFTHWQRRHGSLELACTMRCNQLCYSTRRSRRPSWRLRAMWFWTRSQPSRQRIRRTVSLQAWSLRRRQVMPKNHIWDLCNCGSDFRSFRLSVFHNLQNKRFAETVFQSILNWRWTNKQKTENKFYTIRIA